MSDRHRTAYEKVDRPTIAFGECDCCAAPNRLLHLCVTYGMDTAACSECRGNPLSDDIDDLRDEIDRLRSVASTPEQWAQMCALQGAIIEATARAICTAVAGMR